MKLHALTAIRVANGYVIKTDQNYITDNHTNNYVAKDEKELGELVVKLMTEEQETTVTERRQ